MALFRRSDKPASLPPKFDDVIRPEIPVLYRVASRMVGRATEAEDAVGQTLLIAFRTWDRFDGRHLRSWLITILRNEVLAQHRGRTRRAEVGLEDVKEPEDNDFWREIEWKSVGDRVMSELDRLPEEYRLAVALCDVEELSYEDAAVALGVPVGTIRSRLFRGRRMLRSRLARLVDELEESK